MSPTTDTVSQVPQLLGAVQDFDTLSVSIVAHSERARDSGSKFPLGRVTPQKKICIANICS